MKLKRCRGRFLLGNSAPKRLTTSFMLSSLVVPHSPHLEQKTVAAGLIDYVHLLQWATFKKLTTA